jgi:hypothetical protein
MRRQLATAKEVMASSQKLWPAPIVTKLLPLAADGAAKFWPAEVRARARGGQRQHPTAPAAGQAPPRGGQGTGCCLHPSPAGGVHPAPHPPPQDYHQSYFELNPRQSYCMWVVEPKVAKFRAKWAAKLIK